MDKKKISAVVHDAEEAEQAAVAALQNVILDESRPEEDENDFRDLTQVRGVLPDKLLALTLLSAPTEHPVTRGAWLSPYSAPDHAVPVLLASLLSNTTPVQAPARGMGLYYRFHKFNVGLRNALWP